MSRADPELEELIRLANQEDLGDVAGRLAEEILLTRRRLVFTEEALALERAERGQYQRRANRLRDALLSSLSVEKVWELEWGLDDD